MALIPIFFKADDINNVKKGHIRPKDLSSFLSLMTLNKVGILDVLGDDPCGLKSEVSVSSGFATITLNAGYISILGRLIYIEDGTKIEVTLPSETQTGSFGIRINLAESGSMECSWFTKTTDLQTNNFNDNPENIYEFRLYDYTATENSLTLTNKTTEKIYHLETFFNSASFTTFDVETTANLGLIATTEYVHKLLDKKINIDSDSIMFGSSAVGEILRRGSFVYGVIPTFEYNMKANTSQNEVLFTFDKRFAPLEDTPIISGYLIDYKIGSDPEGKSSIKDIYITPNGEVKGFVNNPEIKKTKIMLGFTFAYMLNN